MKRGMVLPVLLLLGAGCGRDPGARVIVVSGHIDATEVRVATEVSGTVSRFGPSEGDPVAAGTELARIDDRDAAFQADAARAERDLAEANLALARSGARREQVAQADAALAQARAEARSAAADLRRIEELVAAGSGTAKALDDARARNDKAANAARAAEERLKELRAGSRPEELDAAAARLAAAEARLAQAEKRLADTVIASPVSGVLTSKLVEAGEWAPAGTAVAVITDVAHPWLTVFLGETDLDRVRLGQEAEVITDGGARRKGRLSYIATNAEFTPRNVQTREERVKLVYRVKIALDNGDGLFKPGMPAEARITPGAPVAAGAPRPGGPGGGASRAG